MTGARGLSIAWGDTPTYWNWTPLPESRFPEVARLDLVWWLHVMAKVDTKILSLQTTYTAYLVFKLTEEGYGFRRPVQFHVDFEGRESANGFWACLKPTRNTSQTPRDRGDEWKEMKMGEFFNENGEDGSVLCSLKETSCSRSWAGLIVEGIELRPRPAL